MTGTPDDGPWFHEIVLRASDLDYLGHVTEVSHVAMFEEARFHLMAEAMGTEWPVYVVGRHDLRFEREIRLDDGPMRIELELISMDERTVDLDERLLASDGGIRTRSTATLVAFDLPTRRSRHWTDQEVRSIRRHLVS